MKNICIIPARGSSRRIPYKNIKDFHGKPIIAYTIEAALASRVFDVVMVSTESEEVAEVVRSFGALVPWMRPPELAEDATPMYEVIRHTLAEYGKREQFFENACMAYATAPMVTPQDFQESVKLLIGYSAVIAVARDEYHHQRAMVIENGRLRRIYPVDHDRDSSTMYDTYHHAEMLWWVNCNQLMVTGTLHPANTAAYVVPAWRACNIDTPEDWGSAEKKYMVLDLTEGFDKR